MKALLLLVLAGALSGTACAGPGEGSQAMPAQRITREMPVARLALPQQHGRGVLIEVTRVDNPTRAGVTLVVRAKGHAEPLARFALFPPDQPARFALRVPGDVREVEVTLAPEEHAKAAPPLVEVRATAHRPD